MNRNAYYLNKLSTVYLSIHLCCFLIMTTLVVFCHVEEVGDYLFLIVSLYCLKVLANHLQNINRPCLYIYNLLL